MINLNPFIQCPELTTKHYKIRLVEPYDAKNLLSCYSDKEAVKRFNADNCPMDFYFDDESELKKLIDFWLLEYSEGGYVRFSIVDQNSNTAFGTIEIFSKPTHHNVYGEVGVLRLDLPSTYETSKTITELLDLVDKEFPRLFSINSVITKAIPFAKERIKVLEQMGYKNLNDQSVTKYDHYFIKQY